MHATGSVKLLREGIEEGISMNENDIFLWTKSSQSSTVMPYPIFAATIPFVFPSIYLHIK